MKKIFVAYPFWNYDDTYTWVECDECEGSDLWEDDVLGYVNSLIGCDALPADEYYAADNPMGYSGRIHNDKGEVYLFQKDALVAMYWQEDDSVFSGFHKPFQLLNKRLANEDNLEAMKELAIELNALNDNDKYKMLQMIRMKKYDRAEDWLFVLNHLDELFFRAFFEVWSSLLK